MIGLALVVFFLSGIAALLYQVIWQRMLVMFSGADVFSTTLIVAAFMAGLGIGSLSGGHLADRMSRHVSLLLFAAAELAIAAFSVFSRTLYYDLLYTRLGPLALPETAMAGLLFVSLLWPTFFMGVSLPLLARALTARIERAPLIVGALYGVNTLGAAAGALLATWWLLPRFGLETSLAIGAVLNASCALVVLPLAPRLARQSAHEGVRPQAAVERTGSIDTPGHPVVGAQDASFGVWAIIAALAGCLALSLEIVWFRLLGVMVKSTAFTFGTLLAVYLTGLGSGALAGSMWAPRIRRPASVFLGLQTAVGLSATGLIAAFIAVAAEPALQNYFAGYESLDVRASVGAIREQLGGAPSAATGEPGRFLFLYFALPALLILPPTFLMGFSFPILQRVIQTDLARLGRRVGMVLVANIVGSVAGSVLTGWLLLSTAGAAGTLKLLALGGALFAALQMRLGARETGSAVPPRFGRATMALLFAVAVLATPDAATLWARLHGANERRIVFGEDATGLAVVRLDRLSGVGATVFVNGLGQSTIPYGDVHTGLGLVPAFVHPHPQDAFVIGLGSGDTVHAVAGRQEIERIVSIEIVAPQLDTLRRYVGVQPYGGARGTLSDPRITHVAGDGRIYLMRTTRRFDIIEADALRPTSAYSGNLYSDEYFRLVRDRLQPGGLAVTWVPSARVHNTFLRVFPHVLSVRGMLLGSDRPIVLDRGAIAARLADRRVKEHYAAAGIEVAPLMETFLQNAAHYSPAFDRTTLIDVNTDLFPKDEFDLSPVRESTD
jgi:spermidine synthase